MGAHGINLSPEKRNALYRCMLDNRESLTKTAVRFDVHRETVRLAQRQLMEAGFKALTASPESIATDAQPTPPIEVHDAGFWRKQARVLERDIGKMARVVEELGGIRNTPIKVPNWIMKGPSGRKGRAVIGCLLSDIHDGEVIRADEIQGVNEFNPDICAARLDRYFYAASVIGNRWAEDCKIEGVLLALAGDMISGDIHEELRITNAMTSHEQVCHVVGLLDAGITRLLVAYPRIHIVGVPGNHSRSTMKPTAKLYGALSYDMLVMSMLSDRFAHDNRVTFQFGRSKDQITPVFGRTILTTHFDKIGTRGGQGFAGPMLPIIRGAKKIVEQQGSVARRPDLIQGGHYHSTGNPYLGPLPILANGSVVGVSEYADDLRVAVEPPQQWLYLLHDKWWLRERQPIILTDLIKPELPRVRIPAGMARA